ncbi:MAG: glycerol-3-phosphate 1-O-acyltransferase PlsY [Coriobacteriia bacterium]|nr:glycerol-3-phosphate 1-O-acyltransferase PlsY [Coriobacteriia bacterium]
METALRIAVVMIISYFIGAIPFSVIVGRTFYKVDVREHGSGNAGATNVMRVMGWQAGVAVLLLDALKGVAAVLFAMWVHPSHLGSTAYDWVLIGASFAAVLGHSYSPYLRFAGGKGVATAAGALLVVMPAAWPILFVAFAAVVAIGRMVSLGSVVIAALFPVLVLLFYTDRPALITFSFVAASLILWRHRSNIARIARGEEAKISWSRDRSAEHKEDAR